MRKTKHMFGEMKFFVNEEEKMVIAKYKEWRGRDEIIARATCSGSDIFDIATGKRLAAARLEEKVILKKYKQSIKTVESYMKETVEPLKEHSEKVTARLKKLLESL